MSSEHIIADQVPRSLPQGANPDFPYEYDSGPEVLHLPCENTSPVELPPSESEPGLGENEKESDPYIGRKGKIWGMKRKTFILLGVLILLIIAIAAGVGGGVGATAAKRNAHKEASESTKSNPQGSSASISSSPSPTSSRDHPPVVTVTSSISSSPTPTPIRKNTPLAAINWNTSNIQLLYKHEDGSIRFRETDGLKWGEESLQITGLKPKDDSGFSAVSWVFGNVRQVRVYTVSGSNSLWESVWNSSAQSWYSQDISTALDPVAPGSYLTAYSWIDGNDLRIRVYYQRKDGYIREAAFDNGKGWGKGVEPKQGFPQARSGTGLAIVSFPDTNEREAKLFYQSMGGVLTSFDYKRNATADGSWQNQDPAVNHGSIPDGTHITAILNTSGDKTLRIYFIRDGRLTELWWIKKSGWHEWVMHDAAALGVAAVSDSDDVHVFFQTKREYLSEMGLNRLANKWQFIEII